MKIGNTFIDDKMRVKIGDFGLAVRLERGGQERRSSFCGTPNYMAPEVCLNKDRLDAQKMGRQLPPSYYALPVDVWALGVIMYNLLIGKSPFPDGDTKKNYDNIKRARYRPPQASSEARDLIKFILNTDPELRPTLDEILEHPFFTDPSDGMPLRVLPRSFPRTVLTCPPSEEFIAALQ